MEQQSFAIDPRNFAPVEGGRSQGPVIAQATSLGGNANLPQNVPEARADDSLTKTMGALFQLGGAALKPFVEREAQAQFLSGVRKAMEGQALQEIVDEQPWYTEIFGPSGAAEGARFYTAQSRIAELSGQIENQMPRFAEQGPQALQEYANEALSKAMTGDAAADAIITNEFVKTLAPAFKTQAKQQYILQQNKAVEAQTTAYSRSIEALDATFRKPPVDVNDLADRDEQLLNLIGSFTKPHDQSSDKHADILYNAFINNAAQGNVSVLGALKQRGLFDALPADKRDQATRALKQGSLIALDREMPKYAITKAQIEADQAGGIDAYVARREALNRQFAAETGITEVELMPSAQMDNQIKSIIEYNERARAANATKLGKEMAAQQEISTAKGRLASGTLAEGKALGEYDAKTEQQVLTDAFNAAAADPVRQGQILALNPATESKTAQSLFVKYNSEEEYSAGFERAYQVYKGLTSNPVAVDQYLPNAQARRQFEQYDTLVRGGAKPADAYLTTMRVPIRYERDLAADPSGAREKALVEAAASWGNQYQAYNPFSYGKTDLDPAGVRMLARAGQSAFNFGGDPERNALAAITAAQKIGFQKYGSRGVLGMNPDNPPLYTLMKRDIRQVDAAFEAVVGETAQSLGIDTLDDYTILRMPDSSGVARFVVTGTTDEGRAYSFRFDSKHINDQIDKIKPAAFTPKIDGQNLGAIAP